MAGVINLRTRQPVEPFRAQAGLRRQTHNTDNWLAAMEASGGQYAWRLNADRLTSDGYDLHPDTPGLTGPGFSANTFSARLDGSLTSRLSARVNARFATEAQRNTRGFKQEGIVFTFEENEMRNDISISPSLSWKHRPGNTWSLRSHFSDYRTESVLAGGVDGRQPEFSTFDQGMRKVEFQHDLIVGTSLILNTGFGTQLETVEAGRIAGVTRSNRTSWLFRNSSSSRPMPSTRRPVCGGPPHRLRLAAFAEGRIHGKGSRDNPVAGFGGHRIQGAHLPATVYGLHQSGGGVQRHRLSGRRQPSSPDWSPVDRFGRS